MTSFPDNPFRALVNTIKDHGKRLKVAEQRINAIDTRLSKAHATLGTVTPAQLAALATLTAAQIDALQTLSVTQIDAMNTCTPAQFLFLASLSSTQQNFLAGLSVLPNQSDANSTLTGVENFCNNLSDNMQGHGLMAL